MRQGSRAERRRAAKAGRAGPGAGTPSADAVAAWLTEGLSHHRAGRLARAEALYRQALAARPDHAPALHLLGIAAQQAGRTDEAIRRIEAAVAARPDVATYHCDLGVLLQQAGRTGDALAAYDRAARLDPALAAAHNNRGRALQALGRLEEAAAAYREALRLAPGSAQTHNNLGNVLVELGRPAEAAAEFEHAVALSPDGGDYAYSLAYVHERTGAVAEAERAVARGLAAAPGHPGLMLVAAKLDRRAGRIDEALARLQAIDPAAPGAAAFRQEIAFERGRLHDRLNEADAAYRCFAEANRLAAADPVAGGGDKTVFRRYVDAHAAAFTPDWVAGWTPAAAPDGPVPAFLVGFPRSGTTLLGQILDGHPGATVIDEQATVAVVRHRLAAGAEDYPAPLARLGPDELSGLREVYWQQVHRHVGDPAGRLVVDKLPLNIVEAGLIHRLFPQARFILAVRHPCDVCLSCFMQSFRLNHAMANFLTLEDAALLYDKVMALWAQYRAVLPLAAHRVRYEDLVGDFDGTVGGLLAFLGLGWDDGVRRYAERAGRSKRIDTPSYNQVTEPIYTRARYRWRRYEPHLAPVLDRLAPYIADFGYGEEDLQTSSL